jgi:hypothetical protein
MTTNRQMPALTRIHEAADAEEALVSARAQLRHHREVMAHMADDAGERLCGRCLDGSA